MAGQLAAASRETVKVGDSVQKVMVSMIRLSGAVAWYSMEKLQTSVSLQEGEGFPRAMEDLAGVLNSVADSLADKMEPGKRDAMKSVSRVAEQVVGQSLAGLSMIDPRRVVQATNELVQKSAEVISNWPGEAKQRESDGKPRLAVEVLSTRSHSDTGASRKRRAH
jgi:hypothetical protein